MDRPELHLGEKLYQSPFQETSGVFNAEVGHENVVVKSRTGSMERELHILQSLDHPLFPRVKAYFQQDGIHNLVLEKKPGTPLDQLINLNRDWQSDALSVPEGIRIIRELALGLIALKNFSYYYRDFNLGHILVGDKVTALVDHEADVLIERDGSAVVDSHIGTWETMAPEEFAVGSRMTEASTTYSLAVMLHQLTHGRSLFHLPHIEGKSADEMREMSREYHNITPGPENFTHHRHAFEHALQADPSRRYQTLEAFLSDID